MLLVLILCGVAAAQQSQVANSPANDVPTKACVLVYGAVRSPTRLELHRQIRLSEAIELAGGVSPAASADVEVAHSSGLSCSGEQRATPSGCISCLPGSSLSDIHIYKRATLVDENEAGNPLLRNGDIVTVVGALQVFVVGNVAQPQGVSFTAGMTLTSALKSAGGVLPNSLTRRVKIERSAPNKNDRLLIVVDLEKIRKHPEMDFALELNDIIDVPQKGAHPMGNWGSVTVYYPVQVVN